MSEMTPDERPEDRAVVNRRRLLKLGMAAAPAIVTLKGSPALAAASITCSVPMAKYTGSIPVSPEMNFDKDGNFTSAAPDASKGIVGPPSSRILDTNSYNVPGYTGEYIVNQTGGIPDQHMKYLQNLTPGDPGYTCFASLMGRGMFS